MYDPDLKKRSSANKATRPSTANSKYTAGYGPHMARTRRYATLAFAQKPRSEREILRAGDALGLDVTKKPRYMWIAEEYLVAPLPENILQAKTADLPSSPAEIYYYHAKTMETMWEHPQMKTFKDIAYECQDNDIANKRNMFGIMLAALDKAHNRPETPATTQPVPSDLVLNALPPTPPEWAIEATEVVTPEMMKETAAKLGVRLGKQDKADQQQQADAAASETEEKTFVLPKCETFLLPLVCEYLEKKRKGEVPDPWSRYTEEDEAATEYFYNWDTQESTYDNPLTQAYTKIVETERQTWAGRDKEVQESDHWFAFGDTKGVVYYYDFLRNVRTSMPPLIHRTAVNSQRCIRSFLAKRRMKRMRFEAEEKLKRKKAIIAMQRVSRGGRVRRHQQRSAAASTHMQRLYRGKKARDWYKRNRPSKFKGKEELAAIHMQRVARGGGLRIRQKKNQAAVHIQRVARSRAVRQGIARDEATRKIQRLARGRLGRVKTVMAPDVQNSRATPNSADWATLATNYFNKHHGPRLRIQRVTALYFHGSPKGVPGRAEVSVGFKWRLLSVGGDPKEARVGLDLRMFIFMKRWGDLGGNWVAVREGGAGSGSSSGMALAVELSAQTKEELFSRLLKLSREEVGTSNPLDTLTHSMLNRVAELNKKAMEDFQQSIQNDVLSFLSLQVQSMKNARTAMALAATTKDDSTSPSPKEKKELQLKRAQAPPVALTHKRSKPKRKKRLKQDRADKQSPFSQSLRSTKKKTRGGKGGGRSRRRQLSAKHGTSSPKSRVRQPEGQLAPVRGPGSPPMSPKLRYDPGISQILAESLSIVAEAQPAPVKGDIVDQLSRQLDSPEAKSEAGEETEQEGDTQLTRSLMHFYRGELEEVAVTGGHFSALISSQPQRPPTTAKEPAPLPKTKRVTQTRIKPIWYLPSLVPDDEATERNAITSAIVTAAKLDALGNQVGASAKKEDAIAHKYLLQLHRNYHTYYGSTGPIRPLAPNEVIGPRTDPEKAKAALVAAQMSNTVEDALSQMILFEYKHVATTILKYEEKVAKEAARKSKKQKKKQRAGVVTKRRMITKAESDYQKATQLLRGGQRRSQRLLQHMRKLSNAGKHKEWLMLAKESFLRVLSLDGPTTSLDALWRRITLRIVGFANGYLVRGKSGRALDMLAEAKAFAQAPGGVLSFDEEASNPNPADLPSAATGKSKGKGKGSNSNSDSSSSGSKGPDVQEALLSRMRQQAQRLGQGFRKEMMAHVMHAYAHYYFRKRKYAAALEYCQKGARLFASAPPYQLLFREKKTAEGRSGRRWLHVVLCRLHCAACLSMLGQHRKALNGCYHALRTVMDDGRLGGGSSYGGWHGRGIDSTAKRGTKPSLKHQHELSAAEKLSLVTVAHHNLAVEQLHRGLVKKADESAENAFRFGRLTDDRFLDGWRHQIDITRMEALAAAGKPVQGESIATGGTTAFSKRLLQAKEFGETEDSWDEENTY